MMVELTSYKDEFNKIQKYFYASVIIILLSIVLMFVSYYFIMLTIFFIFVAYYFSKRFYEIGIKIPSENIPNIRVHNGKLIFSEHVKYREIYIIAIDGNVTKYEFKKFKNLYPRRVIKLLEDVYVKDNKTYARLVSRDPLIFVWAGDRDYKEGRIIDLMSFDYTFINNKRVFVYFGKAIVVDVNGEEFLITPIVRKRLPYIDEEGIRVYNNGEFQYDFGVTDNNCIVLEPYVPDIYNEHSMNFKIKKCIYGQNISMRIVPNSSIIIIANVDDIIENFRNLIDQLPKDVFYTTIGVYVNKRLVKIFEPDFSVIIYKDIGAIIPKKEIFASENM